MSNRKRHSKKLPKIVQTIQESNILKLDKDIATGVTITYGKIDYPDGNGTGVTLL